MISVAEDGQSSGTRDKLMSAIFICISYPPSSAEVKNVYLTTMHTHIFVWNDSLLRDSFKSLELDSASNGYLQCPIVHNASVLN
jgi:hypothetical protein